jgi:UDPglucose--hexose-1-phosphate uridylyltransferase
MSQSNSSIDAAWEVERLLSYAINQELIAPLDRIAARNALLEVLQLPAPYAGPQPIESPDSPIETLEHLLDDAVERGIIADNTLTHRDLFDTKLMACLVPRPSEVMREFTHLTSTQGIRAATDYFFQLSIDSLYIRMDRIQRNLYWRTPTEYGELEITVNLSKPEKDPREIALLKNVPSASYPKCLLCLDNVGYAGRLNHPARQNLRVIPLQLAAEDWYFQYSPYVYYNEHCIVFHGEHVPMKMSELTFERLLDFLEQFPHYFIGSNADLPIVGGSILNHDHFQGGRHGFPEEQAPILEACTHPDYPEVHAGIVRWPMSVIRLSSQNRTQLIQLALHIFKAWGQYSDASVEILAYTKETPHNTVTPIARMSADGNYELDLVLRNNRTNDEHPEGIFHPHRNLHHIKKENIGLIEVMGLAVLPGRLREELEIIAELLVGTRTPEMITRDAAHPQHKHAAWIDELIKKYGTAMSMEAAQVALREEVGAKYLAVLEDAGVFKQSHDGQNAFRRFMGSLGFVGQK